MTQAHEDSGSVGLHSAFDPMLALGFFDDCSLFADCMSLSFDDYDYVAKMVTTPRQQSAGLAGANTQVVVDAALGDMFDDSFGFFDLDLDLVCSPVSVTQEQAPESPMFDNLDWEAMVPHHEDLAIREPLQKKKKCPKTSSQRQREEIANLRATAACLEKDLQRMKSASRQAPSIKEECRGDDELMVLPLWEAVAKRQEMEKLRAEEENAHLKKQLKANVALAKSLERSVRKRKIKDL